VLKEALKRVAAAGSKSDALKALPEVQSAIDRAVRRRLVHRKTAGRLKARVYREAAEAK
jgi:ribosomal protein S20